MKATKLSSIRVGHGHSRLLVVTGLLFGIDVRPSANICLSRVFLLFSVIIYGVHTYFTVANLLFILRSSSSFAAVALPVYGVLFEVLVGQVCWMYTTKRGKLLELLSNSKNLRACRARHFLLLVLAVPIALLNVKRFITEDLVKQDVGRAVWRFCSTYLFYMRASMLMLYLEAIASLNERNKSIVTFLSSHPVSPARIDIAVKKKWQIRNTIEDLNTMFAMPLAVIYILMFTEVLLIISLQVGRSNPVAFAIHSIGHICLIVEFYVVAQQTSELTRKFMEVERRILEILGQVSYASLMPKSKIQLFNQRISIHWKVLLFNEKWDSLRIAYFTHGLETLFRFTSTCITCIGVVLQFDFQVIKVINELARAYGDSVIKD